MHKVRFDAVRFQATVEVWRKMHEFTLRDLAEMATIKPSTMGFIATGDRVPTIAELVNICYLMDMSPCQFFKEDGKNASLS